MKTEMKNEVKNMENSNLEAQEIYSNFIENMKQRAIDDADFLTEQMANAAETEKILAFQKKIKRLRRRAMILSQMNETIKPHTMQDIIAEVAEPEVLNELTPMFHAIEDLRDALDM